MEKEWGVDVRGGKCASASRRWRLLRMTDGACVLSSFRPSARQTASTVNVRRALRLPPSSDKWPRLPHVPGDAAAAVLVAENSCLRARRTAHVASHTRVGFRSKLTALSKSEFVENYCPNSASGRRVVQLDWIADSIKPKTLITVVCSHSTKTLILSLRPICWIAMHLTGSPDLPDVVIWPKVSAKLFQNGKNAHNFPFLRCLYHYWRCRHNMLSRVCVTGCVRPSVCLSHRSTAATVVGGFGAKRAPAAAADIDRCGRCAAGAGAQQQMRVASCWEPMEEAHKFCY